ncbi:MAG TPA: sigma-70 family RNA polymerase sigma factor [Terriglobia bacterium]|nr:sigma-70 family RNA polymerase sigma factor [Terriglobia bacterium]
MGVQLESILRRARAGDPEAFASLYRLFSRKVLGLCRHLLGNQDEAEDATSEVFLKAQKAMDSYRSEMPFPTWLYSIASHYCVDLLRRRGLESRIFSTAEPVEWEHPSQGPSPLGEVLSAERRETVKRAVAALPQRYRIPLALRYYSDLTYDQIAETIDIPRSNVATLIFRGKKELRRILARAGEEGQS